MQQILELVHVDGGSEVWRPVTVAANLMQFVGTPRVGDFMVENSTGNHFLRPEATRVTVKSVNGDQLQIDLGPDELPNWFANLMHSRQINNDNGVMNLNGQPLEAGVDIVFDGKTAVVEKQDGTVLSTH